MSKIERREQKLIELLHNYQKLEINQISEWFNISGATVRRMCSKLEKEKKVIRIHGGVQLPKQFLDEYSYQNKEQKHLHEKVAIGNYCASLINSNDRIFCDSGTTIHQLVLSLVNRLKAGELKNIVLLSNSLANFDPIADYCKVILIGGEVRLSRLDMCGFVAEDILNKFHITKSFLGADAINVDKGFMTTDERTARMNEIVLSDSEKNYIVVDSSKFGYSSFIAFAGSDQADEVITDWNLPDDTLKEYTKLGYNVRVVDKPDKL